MEHALTTTAFALDGYHVVRNLGVVRGIMVRSRSIFGTVGGSLQTLVGGNISLFTSLCEKTRNEAFELMLRHAHRNWAQMPSSAFATMPPRSWAASPKSSATGRR